MSFHFILICLIRSFVLPLWFPVAMVTPPHTWFKVLVPKDPRLLGKMFEVTISLTGKHYLKGDLVQESLVRAPDRPSPLPAGSVSGEKKWRLEVSEDVKDPSAMDSNRLLDSAQQWLVQYSDIALLLLAVLLIGTAIVVHYGPYIV